MQNIHLYSRTRYATKTIFILKTIICKYYSFSYFSIPSPTVSGLPRSNSTSISHFLQFSKKFSLSCPNFPCNVLYVIHMSYTNIQREKLLVKPGLEHGFLALNARTIAILCKYLKKFFPSQDFNLGFLF